LAFALVAICGLAHAAAQTPPPGQSTSTAANAVTGVVRDASGGVVRGAAVSATPASGAEARGVTDAEGRFNLTPGGSGAIVVVVRAPGFSDAIRRLTPDVPRQNLEIVLSAAPRTESVTVSPPPAPPKPPPAPKPPKPPSPPRVTGAPSINLAYGGIVTGTEAVQKSGGVVGAEAGARVWRGLDVLVEGGSFGDVVTQRQLDVAAPLVTYLAQTQGKAATSTVKMPAVYGGVGARWVFEKINIAGWARPYAQFSVGAARVKREPTFMLGGSDVTASLGQYGVQLGADLTATERRGAFTGGFGVLVPYRMLYFDVGYKMTGIKIPGESINVNRFHIGIGARF
jgi:hypothetical protein